MKKVLSTFMDEQTIKILTKAAKDRKVSRCEIIRAAISEYLPRLDNQRVAMLEKLKGRKNDERH
jgi:hypothetical protein